jgi:hypothetical protein
MVDFASCYSFRLDQLRYNVKQFLQQLGFVLGHFHFLHLSFRRLILIGAATIRLQLIRFVASPEAVAAKVRLIMSCRILLQATGFQVEMARKPLFVEDDEE